jgi:hypothetical protein
VERRRLAMVERWVPQEQYVAQMRRREGTREADR